MSELGLWGPNADLAWWTIAVGAINNAACALLGCYLVLRRLSLLGDAISHAVLPGIVLAFLFAGQSPIAVLAGAMAIGVTLTFTIQMLKEHGGVGEDVGMGITAAALFSAGVVLLTTFARDVHLDASCVLFGEIELIPFDVFTIGGFDVPRVLPAMALALSAVLVFIALLWKELKLAAFDPALAAAAGFSPSFLHYLLMGMTAVVTVSSFKAVGSILVVAMLIVPPATAFLLTDRLRTMFVWSVVVAVDSAFFGYLAASAFRANVGGMSAVAAGVQFALAVLFAPRHGMLSKAWNSLRLSIRIVGEDLTAALFRDEEAGAIRQDAGLPISDLLRRTGGGLVARIALRRLLSRGDLQLIPDGRVSLAEQGRSAAESLVRSHRLWEAYLVENFKLPLDHVHAPAEKIEHFIGPALQRELAKSLPKSDVDPHGREIPPSRTDVPQ